MLDRIDIKYFKMAVGHERLGKESEVDIAARCPVCGDSRSNPRMKRLHLYKSGDFTGVNCFNSGCRAENKTMFSFLRDFFPGLLSGYRREKFQDTLHDLANSRSHGLQGMQGESGDVFDFGQSEFSQDHVTDWETSDIAPLESSGLPRLPEIQDSPDSAFDWMSTDIAPMENPDLTKLEPETVQVINLIPYMSGIESHPEALEYVKSRGLQYTPEKYGEWYYGTQDLEIDGVTYTVKDNIIIPLYYSGMSGTSGIYGFYARSIKDKFFCTFMQDINHGYKIWNWFNVDKTKEVYIFEGIFDALASGLDNIIALMGAKIPQERLDELQKPVFVLDNDTTGLRNSMQYADSGYSVYVQPTQYKEKDMNDLLQNRPGLDIPGLIKGNLYNGIMARVKISSLL